MSPPLNIIPGDVLDENREYFDSHGNEMAASTTRKRSSIDHGAASEDENDQVEADDALQSVYMAAGIHHDIDENVLEDLPRRFEAGNVKARYKWFGALCLAGIGMFVEAYIIITTGQIKSVWSAAYPTCFDPTVEQGCPQNIACCDLFPNTPTNDDGSCAVDFAESSMCADDGSFDDRMLCQDNVLDAQSYSSFAGIMLGMLTFGILADMIGRNAAGILTSVLMIVGVTTLTFAKGEYLETMFLVWAIFFGVFGLGVGGEYPLSASGAADHHSQVIEEAKLDDAARHRIRVMRDHEKTARRGETIGVVFGMQGVGAVVGSIFLLVLLYFSGNHQVECDAADRRGTNSAGYDSMALDGVWRSFYFIGSIFVAMVLIYRYLLVEEGEGHARIQERKRRRAKKLTYPMIFRWYGLRLIATGGCWLVWDICFYGLKLFSGPIFRDLDPDGDLLVQNGWLLVNNIIALVAYYVAAYIIDIPTIGRKRVQILFFVAVSVIFLVMSSIYETAGAGLLMSLYFLTSFFGQFVNTTTYVMAAETYPAELRGTLHGLSAFLGKTGALIATIIFGSIDTPTIFKICGVVGMIGAVLTILFSVDLTHVSLSEHDAQLELSLEGRRDEYKGKLNKTKHLSVFERLTGYHGEYDPVWAQKFVFQNKYCKVDGPLQGTEKSASDGLNQ